MHQPFIKSQRSMILLHLLYQRCSRLIKSILTANLINRQVQSSWKTANANDRSDVSGHFLESSYSLLFQLRSVLFVRRLSTYFKKHRLILLLGKPSKAVYPSKGEFNIVSKNRCVPRKSQSSNITDTQLPCISHLVNFHKSGNGWVRRQIMLYTLICLLLLQVQAQTEQHLSKSLEQVS